MTVGGDIKEVNYQNDEVGSGLFKPKAGETNTLNIGGYRNEDDGAITTDGELIVKKNLKPGNFQIGIANDMNVRKDVETMKALAASTKDTTWTITHVNGKIYRGVGIITSDIETDMDKATVPLKVVAPEFKQL
jgi:hypothetical protein